MQVCLFVCFLNMNKPTKNRGYDSFLVASRGILLFILGVPHLTLHTWRRQMKKDLRTNVLNFNVHLTITLEKG